MLMQPITYKVPTFVLNASGGSKITYPETDYVQDWAEVNAVRSQFENIAGSMQQGDTKRFKIRYRASLLINDKWLISYEGQDYKISTIEADQRKTFFTITGKAVG